MVISLLGGCINRQKNLTLKKHYHFLLRDKLFEANGQMPDVQLNNYSSYLQLPYIVKQLVSRPATVFVLFIRPFPLHTLIKPVIRYHDKDQHRRRIALHPAISGNTEIGNRIDEFAERNENRGAGRRRVKPLARINLLAGEILGLQKWALKYIRDQIIEANEHCRRNNTKLIIAGPPAYPAYAPINKLCYRFNKHIADLCADMNIPHAVLFATTDTNGLEIFETDGIHFNEAGHARIAGELFNIIKAWEQ